MERYASRESFGFSRDVIGRTRICTIVDKLALIFLQGIMTHLFVSLGMFAI